MIDQGGEIQRSKNLDDVAKQRSHQAGARLVLSTGDSARAQSSLKAAAPELMAFVKDQGDIEINLSCELSAGETITAHTSSVMGAVWLLNVWVDSLDRATGGDDWLGGCQLRLSRNDPQAIQVYEPTQPNTVIVDGTCAMVAALGLDQKYALCPAALEHSYEIMQPQAGHAPTSDIGWAVRAVEGPTEDGDRERLHDEALLWIAEQAIPWSVVLHARTTQEATRAAARTALALHRDGHPILHSRVVADGCPIATLIEGRIAREVNGTHLRERWHHLQSRSTSRRFVGLTEYEIRMIEAGASFLSETVGGTSPVLIIDGVDLDQMPLAPYMDLLLEVLAETDISVLFATYGEQLPDGRATAFVDRCVVAAAHQGATY